MLCMAGGLPWTTRAIYFKTMYYQHILSIAYYNCIMTVCIWNRKMALHASMMVQTPILWKALNWTQTYWIEGLYTSSQHLSVKIKCVVSSWLLTKADNIDNNSFKVNSRVKPLRVFLIWHWFALCYLPVHIGSIHLVSIFIILARCECGQLLGKKN